MLVRGKAELWLGGGRCILDLTSEIVARIFVAEGQASGNLSDTFYEWYNSNAHLEIR